MSLRRLHESLAASRVSLIFSPSSRPSTPSVSEKALKLVRRLSIAHPPKQFRRARTTSSQSRRLRKSKRSSSSSSSTGIPKVPPLPYQLPPLYNREDVSVHFDAVEFLTLGSDPWVGVSLSHQTHPDDEMDFGLEDILLDSSTTTTTTSAGGGVMRRPPRRESLLSLYSYYSLGASCPMEDHDPCYTTTTTMMMATTRKNQNSNNESILLYDSSQSNNNNNNNNNHTTNNKDNNNNSTPSLYHSSSSSESGSSSSSSSSTASPRTPTLSTSTARSSSVFSYYTLSYLPEFRKDVIVPVSPPPRPPRRRPPPIPSFGSSSPSSGAKLTRSRTEHYRSGGGTKAARGRNGDARLPLVARRLTSSSRTSLRNLSRNGSTHSLNSSTVDIRPYGYI